MRTSGQTQGPSQRPRPAWLFLLALLVWHAPALAGDPAGQPFRLEYWATGHCPDSVEFARQIRARTPKLRPAEPGEPALAFFAELSEREGGAVGKLTSREPDGQEVTREVTGTSCDDVVTALALIAALSVDPNQTVSAKPRVPEAPKPDEIAEPPRAPEPAPLPLRNWAYGVGVGLGLNTAVAPNPGAGLSLELDAESQRPGAYRPLLSLTINFAESNGTAVPGGTASFTWIALRGADCPVIWPEERPLYVRPCFFVDAGSLESDMHFNSRHSDHTVAWFAVGGFGRLQADAVGALSLTLDGGFIVPVIRAAFVPTPGPNPEMYRVPQTGLLGRIGLSAKF